MASNLFLVETIQRKNSDAFISKQKNYLNFFMHFSILH